MEQVPILPTIPVRQPGDPRRDTHVHYSGQTPDDFLDPADVKEISAHNPRGESDLPFSKTLAPEHGAITPTRYASSVEEALLNDARRSPNRSGMSVQELATDSREYILVRQMLADLVYDSEFREHGQDAITSDHIDMIERFHMRYRGGPDQQARHESELRELAHLLRRAHEPSEHVQVFRAGITELLDFIEDPFFCHQAWLLCVKASS